MKKARLNHIVVAHIIYEDMLDDLAGSMPSKSFTIFIMIQLAT